MTPTEDTSAPAPDVPEAVLPDSPGQTLRRARERAGFSIEDLAAQLKLTRSTLESLEADDFEILHEPVYVRGYYRKCAKLLPVTAAELIAAYDARAKPMAPPSPRRVPLAGGANVASATSGGGGLYLAIGAGLLFGLALWLGSGESPPPPKPVVAPPVAAEVEALPSVADTPIEPSSPSAAPAVASTEPPPAAAETETTVVVLPPPPTPVTPPAAVAVGETLTMNFTEASWVRVEDARNKMLLIGLVRAGERKILRGEVPYTVFIGNAQKVQVEFRGKVFDFSRYVQNDTARFTVP